VCTYVHSSAAIAQPRQWFLVDYTNRYTILS
jgi:hypothetical protein